MAPNLGKFLKLVKKKAAATAESGSEAKAETEWVIYLQALHIDEVWVPERAAPAPVGAWGEWFKIRDSDLHNHNHKIKKKKNPTNHDRATCCGLHKEFHGEDGGYVDELPCGDFIESIPVRNPPNVMGQGALIAVPNDPSTAASPFTVYLIGGFDRAACYGHRPPTGPKTSPSGHYVTEEVFYRYGDSECQQAPPMIRPRSHAHPVFYDGKIYVFGSKKRRWGTVAEGGDSPYTADWWPWAEFLDLGEDDWKWQGLANPPKELGHHRTIAAHCIVGGNKILLYSDDTGDILSYDPVNDSYGVHARGVGKFGGAAAFMDGILYGVSTWPRDDDLYCDTIYYFDICSPGGSAKFLVNLRPLYDGNVIPNGLIPVGRDILYVVIAKNRRSPGYIALYGVYILKYRMAKKKINDSFEVEATVEAKGSYYFYGVTSIEGCLAVNMYLDESGGKEGREEASEEGGKGTETPP